MTTSRSGSPQRPSPGVSARSPAGDTSWSPQRADGDARGRARSPPSSGRTDSSPTGPLAMAGVLSEHGCGPSADSRLCCSMSRPRPLPGGRAHSRRLRRIRRRSSCCLPISGLDGYDTRPTLDDEGWRLLLQPGPGGGWPQAGVSRRPAPACRHDGGERRRGTASARRIVHLVVPRHRPSAHRRNRSGELTRQVRRIAHTHLKDVDAGMAAKVQAGRLSYTEAVGQECTARSAPAM